MWSPNKRVQSCEDLQGSSQLVKSGNEIDLDISHLSYLHEVNIFCVAVALFRFHLIVRSSGNGEELHRFSESAALQQEFCGPVDLKPVNHGFLIRRHCDYVTSNGQPL